MYLNVDKELKVLTLLGIATIVSALLNQPWWALAFIGLMLIQIIVETIRYIKTKIR